MFNSSRDSKGPSSLRMDVLPFGEPPGEDLTDGRNKGLLHPRSNSGFSTLGLPIPFVDPVPLFDIFIRLANSLCFFFPPAE